MQPHADNDSLTREILAQTIIDHGLNLSKVELGLFF